MTRPALFAAGVAAGAIAIAGLLLGAVVADEWRHKHCNRSFRR